MKQVVSRSLGDEDRVFRALLGGGPQTVRDLVRECQVTATAVRHHLQKLMAQGLVERRECHRGGRGRPSYVYYVPDSVRSELGNNFSDLAVAMWEELDQCQDRGFAMRVLRQVGDRLGRFYGALLGNGSLKDRVQRLAGLLRQRGVAAEAGEAGDAAVLRLLHCPYQRLAEGDRKVCGIEHRMLTAALGGRVRLQKCRLDGHPCCEFRIAGSA